MSPSTGFVLQPPSRLTLTESVTDSLREAIFAGMFQPGERLAEAQLAGRLQVSRAPIREALALLEKEGLVGRAAGGMIVSRLTRDDVVEICTLRHSLELLAVRLVLGHGRSDVCAMLADNIERTREATGPRELAALDLEFHEMVVRAARHQRLLTGWLALRSQVRLLMTQRNLVDSQSHAGTLRTHETFLAHLRDRPEDVAGIIAMLEQQLQSQYEWFMRSFDERAPGTLLPAVACP